MVKPEAKNKATATRKEMGMGKFLKQTKFFSKMTLVLYKVFLVLQCRNAAGRRAENWRMFKNTTYSLKSSTPH